MTDKLISKELLLKEVDEVIAQYNWAEDGVIMDILMCIRDMVFDQPTTYDIDEIIEQLKKNYSCDVGNLKMISLDKAIEIVKKRGIEWQLKK